MHLLSLKNAFRARLPSKLHRQLIHQHHLQSHLHCGNDPTVANHNGILSTAHARKTLETPFTMRNRSENDPTMIRPHTRPSRTRRTAEVIIGVRGRTLYGKTQGFVHLLSLKNAFRARLPSKLHRQLIHQHHLQSHLHCGNDPTVANHNGILSTAHARKTLETPFTMRNRSENDPTMIRPHTRPSRTRRTAEVDHRRSGTDFVWKNTRFRASAISQKRISCETSFKTPSATHPPAPLAIPFTLREQFL